MDCEYNINDCVTFNGLEGKVIEIVDIGGECFLKIQTDHGDFVKSCDDVEPC